MKSEIHFVIEYFPVIKKPAPMESDAGFPIKLQGI
jgi:hypothetical protein